MFNNIEKKELNITDYINGIICNVLFYMEAEHFNLGINGKKNFIS